MSLNSAWQSVETYSSLEAICGGTKMLYGVGQKWKAYFVNRVNRNFRQVRFPGEAGAMNLNFVIFLDA
jgi:hypothetical protein